MIKKDIVKESKKKGGLFDDYQKNPGSMGASVKVSPKTITSATTNSTPTATNSTTIPTTTTTTPTTHTTMRTTTILPNTVSTTTAAVPPTTSYRTYPTTTRAPPTTETATTKGILKRNYYKSMLVKKQRASLFGEVTYCLCMNITSTVFCLRCVL